MIILSFTLSLIVQGVLTLLGCGGLVFVCLSSLCSPLSICIVLIFSGKKDGEDYILVKNKKRLNGIAVLLAVFLSCGMFLGFGFINSLFSQLLYRIGISVSSPEVIITTFRQFLLALFCLCFFPAVYEELFFRNFFIKNLKDMRFIALILINGLIFSLYHRSLSQLLYQFIFGVNLAILYLKTENAIPCITAHFLNNFAIVLFLYLGVSINFFALFNIVIGLTVLCLFYIIVFYNAKTDKAFSKKENPASISYYFIPFGLTGIAICVLYIVLGAVNI